MITQNDLQRQVVEELPRVDISVAASVAAMGVAEGCDIERYATDENYNHLAGRLAEVNLRQRLHVISDTLGGKMQVSPIPHMTQKDGLEYRTDRLGSLYIAMPGEDAFCEIDALAVIDGLPTIFEINLSRKYGSRGASQHRTGANLRAAGNFREKRTEQLTIPISEYFNSQCGYVVILAPHNVKPNSPTQQAFKEQGGIIIPHFMLYAQYRAAVKQIGDELKRARDLQAALD